MCSGFVKESGILNTESYTQFTFFLQFVRNYMDLISLTKLTTDLQMNFNKNATFIYSAWNDAQIHDETVQKYSSSECDLSTDTNTHTTNTLYQQ